MNIVLLTGKRLSSFKYQVLETLLASNHKIAGCLVDDRPKPSLPHRLRSNLRKGRGGYTLIMALSLLERKEPGVAIRPVLESQGIPVYSVQELASEASKSIIRNLRPDVLVLLGGFGIVKQEVADDRQAGDPLLPSREHAEVPGTAALRLGAVQRRTGDGRHGSAAGRGARQRESDRGDHGAHRAHRHGQDACAGARLRAASA